MEPCVSCIYLTYCMEWNMYENLPHESIYFEELHNAQECYWPTIYRAGAAVESTITSSIVKLIRKSKILRFFFCYSIATLGLTGYRKCWRQNQYKLLNQLCCSNSFSWFNNSQYVVYWRNEWVCGTCLRWCYMRRFATTILSATQRSNVGTMLQPFETMSQQCCNAALR